jgi:thioredoxin 2
MPATSNVQVIRCQNCGTNNKVNQASALQRTPICGRCKTPLALNLQPTVVTDANFESEIKNSALPVLLDLWAPWCGPCRMIAPIIEQLAKELAGQARIGKLNVDENPMTAAQFNVQGIPTLLILKNGREVDRIVGVQPKEAILRRLQSFI